MRIIFENNHSPAIGKYKDAIVEDPQNDLVYVYDCCGTYTTIISGDANLTRPFTDVDEVVWAHNLGKYPAVTILDELGNEIGGEVQHNSLNQVTVSFSENVTGTIVLN